MTDYTEIHAAYLRLKDRIDSFEAAGIDTDSVGIGEYLAEASTSLRLNRASICVLIAETCARATDIARRSANLMTEGTGGGEFIGAPMWTDFIERMTELQEALGRLDCEAIDRSNKDLDALAQSHPTAGAA